MDRIPLRPVDSTCLSLLSSGLWPQSLSGSEYRHENLDSLHMLLPGFELLYWRRTEDRDMNQACADSLQVFNTLFLPPAGLLVKLTAMMVIYRPPRLPPWRRQSPCRASAS